MNFLPTFTALRQNAGYMPQTTWRRSAVNCKFVSACFPYWLLFNAKSTHFLCCYLTMLNPVHRPMRPPMLEMNWIRVISTCLNRGNITRNFIHFPTCLISYKNIPICIKFFSLMSNNMYFKFAFNIRSERTWSLKH